MQNAHMKDLSKVCCLTLGLAGILFTSFSFKIPLFADPEVRRNFSGNSPLRALKQRAVAEITACLRQCFSLDFPWGRSYK